MNPPFVDQRQVARRFSAVAVDYPQRDFFAREVDRRMQERLDYVRLAPSHILDLGCSRRGSLPALKARYPQAQQIGVDLAPAMLKAEQPERPAWQRLLGLGRRETNLGIAADASALPLPPASVDLVWSNLLMHWLDDPRQALAEAHRVMRVGGLLMFSTLGPDTLHELRSAFGDSAPRTQRFIDMHDFGDWLVGAGFSDPVMDMEMLTLTYADFDHLLRELRGAGSGCAMTDRPRGLFGRQAWHRVRSRYEALRVEGKLPASFEIIYGHAWKAAPKQTTDGRAIVRFEPRRPR